MELLQSLEDLRNVFDKSCFSESTGLRDKMLTLHTTVSLMVIIAECIEQNKQGSPVFYSAMLSLLRRLQDDACTLSKDIGTTVEELANGKC